MYDIVSDACDRAERFESIVLHLYLDTDAPPNVTAAAGHVVASPAAATELFACDMTAQFGKVLAAPRNRIAEYYAQFTTARLTTDQVRDILRQDMGAKYMELMPRIPGWNALPYNVRLANLDLAFNLGVWGFLVKFPTFIGLLQGKPLDLPALAAQSKREERDPVTGQIRELNPPRNAEIAQLILSA